MKRSIKTSCPRCSKPLTPGEMIDQWCEGCEAATNVPRRPTEAPKAKRAA